MERTLQSFKRQDVPSELLTGPDISRLYFDLVCDWIVVISSAYLMYVTPYWLYPLWAVIIAGRLHAFGVILHDLCHMNLNKKTLNIRILEIFSGYIIGKSANAMAYHHIRHHRDTLKDNDPYYNINKKCIGIVRFWLAMKKGLIFVPYWIMRTYFAPFALMFPDFRTTWARIFLQDVSGKNLSHDKEVITCAKEDIPIMLFQSLLFYLAVTRFDFLFYCYYYVIPAGGVFCIYRLLIEHEYNIVKDRSVYTMIESTFDHHTSVVEKIFVGPHNIGFHCVHHIHPSVGLHHLPKLRDWYLSNSLQYQEKYQTPVKLGWKQDLFGGIHKE
ncbi:MAG: fatty acid desaturase [Rhizobacter sp.]|nr:fatty acid desaturase [Bacteriovorax sp.]